MLGVGKGEGADLEHFLVEAGILRSLHGGVPAIDRVECVVAYKARRGGDARDVRILRRGSPMGLKLRLAGPLVQLIW